MMGIDDIFISFITSYITGMIDRLAELMMKRDTAFGTQHIRRGLTKHKAVDGYISRLCGGVGRSTLKDPCFKERILPVVVDDTIRDNQYYVDLVSYWKKQKEEQENMLQQLMEIDPDMVYPQEVSCKEIMEVYGLLYRLDECRQSGCSLCNEV